MNMLPNILLEHFKILLLLSNIFLLTYPNFLRIHTNILFFAWLAANTFEDSQPHKYKCIVNLIVKVLLIYLKNCINCSSLLGMTFISFSSYTSSFIMKCSSHLEIIWLKYYIKFGDFNFMLYVIHNV